MKKLILLSIGVLFAVSAYAACRTYTIITPDGKSLFCMECCNGDHCTVTCN